MSQTPQGNGKNGKGQGKEKETFHSSGTFDMKEKDYINIHRRELQEELKSAKNEDQKKNIKAALEIYRRGNIPGGGNVRVHPLPRRSRYAT